MMMVSEDVRGMARDLKNRTGASIMDCRKVLIMAEMDIDAAEKYLLKYPISNYSKAVTPAKPEEGFNGC